jgi:hypothetical protein
VPPINNCLTVIKIWSWSPLGTWHQDRLAEWLSIITWIWPCKHFPIVCGVGAVTCTRNAQKRAYVIDTDMLQLQVGGRRGTSSLQLSMLQACQGRDAKEKFAESTQDYSGKGVFFQPHHPRTILHGSATQQHTATVAASVAFSWRGLRRHSGRNECAPSLEEQPTTSTKWVSWGS